MRSPRAAPDFKQALLQAALVYAKRGWRVFPLQPGLKIPFPGFSWPTEATTDRPTIKRWWTEEYPGANIGIICGGKRGPIVLDVDGPEAEALVKSLHLPTTLEATTGREGRRHLYLASNGRRIGRLIRPFGKQIPLDVLGTGGYVVAPPSYRMDTHTSYRWTTNGDTPLAPFPTKVVRQPMAGDRNQAVPSTNGTEVIDLRKPRIPAVIPEGERDDILTSLAGSMRRRGASKEAIYAALREENELKCRPPLSDKQVRKIARSIAKKDPETDNEQALHELNRTYAVVQVGSKVRVLQQRADGTIELLGLDDFRAKLSNQFIYPASGPHGEAKRVPTSQAWLSWEARAEFDDLVFEPGAPARKRVFNLWRGFAVEPSRRGSCERFLAHLRDNVCEGKRSRYDWLLGWFAQLVQEPGRKLGTAVVLRGPQGVGKTIVGKTIGHLLGGHYFTASSPRYVTGRFNSHLERCLLLQAEEAFWAGDKAAEGVLKDLITSGTQAIERKGLEPITVANHLRLLVTSNAHWVVPAGYDERRFAIFDVSDACKQDHEYFGAIVAELAAGGYAKLLHTLQHHPHDEAALRQVPMTAALREQIVASLPPKDAWLLDLLMTGQVAGVKPDRDGRVLVAIPALYKQYCAHAKIIGIGRRDLGTEFGMWLRDHLPGDRRAVRKLYDPTEGKRMSRNSVWLAPLAECRARFSERVPGYHWSKQKAWTLVEEAHAH